MKFRTKSILLYLLIAVLIVRTYFTYQYYASLREPSIDADVIGYTYFGPVLFLLVTFSLVVCLFLLNFGMVFTVLLQLDLGVNVLIILIMFLVKGFNIPEDFLDVSIVILYAYCIVLLAKVQKVKGKLKPK